MSKILFYVTGYLFSETSLKTNMRKTKSLIIYLGAQRKLIWACFVTQLWLDYFLGVRQLPGKSGTEVGS